MVKKFKKQKKLSKSKKDKNPQKNINKISLKKLSKIKIENYQKGFCQKYQNVLILQDGNILVNTANNILIIYDKNNFSIINKYDINYSAEEKYISSIIQLNNGYFACCMTFYSSKTDLIIFDISKNKVKIIQKIIFDQMVSKIACMTNWDLVVGIFGYCQFYKFEKEKENYILKDTIKFKYGNFYVTQIYEIEKDKILFVGDHDCGNFSGAYIYHMLNGQKQLLFEVSDKFSFELYDKAILINNKYIIIANIDKTIIVFDINNKQINLIKEYDNDIFNIIKINDNYFLTGDYRGYLTLYNFDNGEINEIKNKKVSRNHFSITILKDNKIIILDKRTGDLSTYQIDGIKI